MDALLRACRSRQRKQKNALLYLCFSPCEYIPISCDENLYFATEIVTRHWLASYEASQEYPEWMYEMDYEWDNQEMDEDSSDCESDDES